MEERTISSNQQHRIAIIGCGALGSEIVFLLAQHEINFMRLVDRDFLEKADRGSHCLYKEHNFLEGMPKAIALKELCEEKAASVKIEAIVEDVNRTNILSLLEDIDLVIDAVNNRFTHQLINEACVNLKRPLLVSWIDGSHGAAMTVIPGKTSCLNCILESKEAMPDISLNKTKSPLPQTISAIAEAQVFRAIEILKSAKQKFEQRLLVIDGKNSARNTIDITKSKIQPNCAVCNNRQFRRLDGKIGSAHIHPIGENSLQIIPFTPRKIDLPTLAFNLSEKGDVLVNDFLLIFKKPPYELVIFPSGRTLVRGTTDSGIAMDLVKKFLVSGK